MNDPVNEPVLICTELLTVPTGNAPITCNELETTPPPNAVVGILPLCINIPGTRVFVDIKSQTKG